MLAQTGQALEPARRGYVDFGDGGPGAGDGGGHQSVTLPVQLEYTLKVRT